MRAYMITQIEWTTPEARQKYIGALAGMAERHGGRWVVASSELKTVEGQWKAGRLVIVEFPTMKALTDWYESDEYRLVRELRLKNAQYDSVMVQGS